MELFKKTYDGESIVDVGRDVFEAFDKDFADEIRRLIKNYDYESIFKLLQINITRGDYQ